MGLTYFASIGMAQQKMYSPQKWLHSIVMLGAELRSTCYVMKKDVTELQLMLM